MAQDLKNQTSTALEIKHFSLQMKRRLLKRSKALTMDISDRVGVFRNCLFTLPESELVGETVPEDEKVQTIRPFPNLPDKLLKVLGLFDSLPENNKNLNEPDIEEKFARLSLAFKTDKFTLGKRLDLQLRQRDIAEKNIDCELKALRESLNALNQLCTESDMREIITKTQQHVDIVQQATMRMSSRAETYGAIQQEQRMNCAFETMMNYVEHLKLLYDKEHLELEEYRRLLAEHNLLPDEKGLLEGDDSKRILPPRSQSLSSSTKPEARTRLLSSICLLNNNYESPRTTSNGSTTSAGSVSPKSRRSSLPAGPTHSPSSATQQSPGRPYNSITEKYESKPENKDGYSKSAQENHLTRTESTDSAFEKDENDSSALQEHAVISDETPPDKDSSELNFANAHISCMDQENTSNLACSLQESTCDNEIEGDICLLPEICIPVNSKPLYLLDLIQLASIQRMWRWDSATLILHARYTLSAVLAATAVLTLVLTFVSNQVI